MKNFAVWAVIGCGSVQAVCEIISPAVALI